MSGVKDCASCDLQEGEWSRLGNGEMTPLYALPNCASYENTSPFMRESVRVCKVFCIAGPAIRPMELNCLRAIFSLSARSIERNSPISAPETSVEARPAKPMRPVRPTR